MGIVDVHLAAERFDVDLAQSVHAGVFASNRHSSRFKSDFVARDQIFEIIWISSLTGVMAGRGLFRRLAGARRAESENA
jgi:hypothetical protein